MKVETASYIRALRGTYKTTDLVMQKHEGETVARAKVKPANPQTADQLKVRGFAAAATRAWHTTSEQQRAAWGSYGDLYFDEGNPDKSRRSLALRMFVRANIVRQALGLSILLDAPTLAPPSKPVAVRQLGAQNPDAVGIEVDHLEPVTAGLLVLVRATAAMRSTACKPDPNDHRYVCGVGPGSFAPLNVSGTPMTFSPSKFVVNDGQRYGVEVRIVRTADGVAGAPVYGDFLKSV